VDRDRYGRLLGVCRPGSLEVDEVAIGDHYRAVGALELKRLDRRGSLSVSLQELDSVSALCLLGSGEPGAAVDQQNRTLRFDRSQRFQVGHADLAGADYHHVIIEASALQPLGADEPEQAFDDRAGRDRRRQEIGDPQSSPSGQRPGHWRAQVQPAEDEQAGGVIDPYGDRVVAEARSLAGDDARREGCQRKDEDEQYRHDAGGGCGAPLPQKDISKRHTRPAPASTTLIRDPSVS
jgi:hypothetical protein